jgi:hypothetical protein
LGNPESKQLLKERYMLSTTSVVVAAQDQVSSDLGGEVAILNLKNGVYYGLDEVGARIWNLIQEPKAVHEIRDVLLDEYQVEIERCERDLLTLLEELVAENLVQVRDGTGA